MKIPMAPEFMEIVNASDNPSDNVTFLDKDHTSDPVSGNAFVGGHYNTKFSIPEFLIPYGDEANISEGYLYLIDKDGNRFLYAIFDPSADSDYGTGRFTPLEEYYD